MLFGQAGESRDRLFKNIYTGSQGESGDAACLRIMYRGENDGEENNEDLRSADDGERG